MLKWDANASKMNFKRTLWTTDVAWQRDVKQVLALLCVLGPSWPCNACTGPRFHW